MAAELGNEFSIEKSLETGLVPLVWSSEHPAETVRGYIDYILSRKYARRELIRNLTISQDFSKRSVFLMVMLLSISDISRECQVKRSTVDGYIEILEDLLIAKKNTGFFPPSKTGACCAHKILFL